MAPKTGLYVGLGISLVIVLAIVGGIIAMQMRGNSIGEPVATKAPGMLEPIELNLDLAKLITLPPESAGGAEVPYQETVKLAVAYGDLFADHISSSEHPEQDKDFKAILDKLEEAADKGLGNTVLQFDSLPPLSPKTEWDIRATLYGVEKVATLSTMSLRDAGDNAGAEKALRAGLLWGYRLFKNGEDVVAYKSAGIASISEALAQAGEQYKKSDPVKAAAAQELYKTYRVAGDRWYAKQKLFLVPDLRIEPADLWNLAEHDRDKAWRVEGIMWLGVAQWTSASGKQRSAVQAYLVEKSNSTDPTMAHFAKEAAKMTRDDTHEVAAHLPR